MSYDAVIDEILQAEPDKISRILRGEEEIGDPTEIEDVLLEINRLERNVEFFKKLKKRRTEPLDQRIKESDAQIDQLREAILDCMERTNNSSLDFPEVAKISCRKKAGSWDIKDEANVEEHLQELGVLDDVATRTLKFDKRKLYKLLNELLENNNVPEGAEKSEDSQTVAISFYEKAEDRAKQDQAEREAARWKKAESNYDSLTI